MNNRLSQSETPPAESTGRDSGLPLAGIVVADFSRVLAGPMATMTLADLGATVIKVEHPLGGDDTRSWAPPVSADGVATYYDSVNRNKRSVRLNLRDPGDLDRARELIRRADVLVENFRPGYMASIGLDYEEAAALNPSLIYVSISGFGASGAGRDLLGYDFVAQAAGGLMHITGAPEGSPMKVGLAVVDVLAGKDALVGILAALYRRHSHGVGAKLEINLLSSLQAALVNQGQAVLGAGVEPGRMGNAHPSICPYEALRCADGDLAIACGNDKQFRRLAEVLGTPALADDPRFVGNADRVVHRSELIPILEAQLLTASADEWERKLTEVGVPVSRVRTISGGLEFAERVGTRPLIDLVDRDGHVTGRQVRNPVTWSPALAQPKVASPRLGEDDEWFSEWLGSSRLP